MVDKYDKLEVQEDILLENEDFKKTVAIPYFKDIFKDLVKSTDKGPDEKKGVDQITFLQVSPLFR